MDILHKLAIIIDVILYPLLTLHEEVLFIFYSLYFYKHKVHKLSIILQIDIIQVSLLKMLDREGAPMYHIEHFVEGKYVKYNSNSGFVLKEDEAIRSTPQVPLFVTLFALSFIIWSPCSVVSRLQMWGLNSATGVRFCQIADDGLRQIVP